MNEPRNFSVSDFINFILKSINYKQLSSISRVFSYKLHFVDIYIVLLSAFVVSVRQSPKLPKLLIQQNASINCNNFFLFTPIIWPLTNSKLSACKKEKDDGQPCPLASQIPSRTLIALLRT